MYDTAPDPIAASIGPTFGILLAKSENHIELALSLLAFHIAILHIITCAVV